MVRCSGRLGPVLMRSWRKRITPRSSVQVNGKLRAHLSAPFGTPEETLRQRALDEPKVKQFVNGKQVMKVIVVPDRLVNIVVKG